MANIPIIIFCVVLKNFLASSILYYMFTFFSPGRMTESRKTGTFPIISCGKFTHRITIALTKLNVTRFDIGRHGSTIIIVLPGPAALLPGRLLLPGGLLKLKPKPKSEETQAANRGAKAAAKKAILPPSE